MSVQSQDALKSLGQGFKESKRKQLLSFLEDQKQLTIRLRKCSFDTTKPGSSDVGRTHRLRPLSARPKTAETSEPYSESSYNNESRRRPVSKLVRRPSTACGLHPSEENDYSDEESEFDALSITSIQSGTPSIGDLGNIDELDEDEEDISVANMKLQRQRPSAIDLTMKDATYSSDNSSNFSAKFRNVSSVYISDKRVPSGKPGSKSRRKSASSLKHSQFSVGATSSIVEPGSITSVTTIECSASLYKKIRHHSAPATRNDEIIARMGQASKRPVGLFRLPPLASERALPGANCSEHSSPSPESNFIRTQSLLETEPIL
ncbi:hypothetical protein HOLleu_07046 [Holothuria leucospilota]|uniref:Uncharacterized protein n=1 Tax=Holothuria leucospilota TaxID=206669 RepID=A0A9Q1CFC8_HOLLE|nr:hypothetical protein HOLleu_07046 [Holothuria leucospilota]